jgi:hypothetical protein
MGWCSGSEVMDRIIKAMKKEVKDSKLRYKLYLAFIDALEDRDWDCQEECLGQDEAFDKALYKLHPSWEFKKDDE